MSGLVAVIGGRRFPDVPACPFCQAPVRTVDMALGPQVEHYDPDASYRDSVWRYCHLAVAAMPTPGGTS